METRIVDSTATQIILTNTSTEILPANPARLGFEISNCNETNSVFMKIGGTAEEGKGRAILKNTVWAPDKIITGQIVGIAPSGSHTITTIEYF